MKRVLILSVVALVASLSMAQTSFSKKEWKKFNKGVSENLKTAEQFYRSKLDLQNRDEITGMPSSKIPLINSSRTFIDAATYSCTNIYKFEDASHSKSFIKALKENMKTPDGFELAAEDSFVQITGKGEPGLKPTIEISMAGKVVMIHFYPPLDIPIPNDL